MSEALEIPQEAGIGPAGMLMTGTCSVCGTSQGCYRRSVLVRLVCRHKNEEGAWCEGSGQPHAT